MKKTLLFLAFLAFFSTSFAQFTYEHLEVDYTDAIQFKELKIIPIRAKASFAEVNQRATRLNNALSLEQALATEQAIITERKNRKGRIRPRVNTLTIENFSDQPIFLMSGEVITGGMQDRVIARDMIIEPRSGMVNIPVFCVEEGRWTGSTRKKKFQNYHEASMHLRFVIDRNQNQVDVWKEISKENKRDNVRTSTQAYTAHANSPDYIRRENEYLTFFNNKFKDEENIVGIVGITGGIVMGCDIFASTDLFKREYNNLIFAYIDEALTFGVPVTMTDAAGKRYMDNILSNSAIQDRFVRQNGKMFKQGEQIIHITTY
jgi:hypothetical protein